MNDDLYRPDGHNEKEEQRGKTSSAESAGFDLSAIDRSTSRAGDSRDRGSRPIGPRPIGPRPDRPAAGPRNTGPRDAEPLPERSSAGRDRTIEQRQCPVNRQADRSDRFAEDGGRPRRRNTGRAAATVEGRAAGNVGKKRYKRKNKRSWLRVTIWIASILIISAALTYGAVYTFTEVMGLNMDDDVIVIITEEDNTTEKIANRLVNEGVIKNAFLFRLFSRLKGADGTYKFGTFSLSANTDYSGIIERLQKDGLTANTVKVLVREGANVDSILNIVERSGVCSKADFKEAMSDYINANMSFLRDIPDDKVFYRLEGYLYPATYNALQIKEWSDSMEGLIEAEKNNPASSAASSKAASSGAASSVSGNAFSAALTKEINTFYTQHSKDSKANAKNLVNAMMVKTYNMLEYTSSEYPISALDLAKQQGKSVHEILTMASIIEAESGASTENMPKVSAVFYNRLEWKTEPPLLGSDPTMLYAEKFKAQYYNTRKYEKLPPGPINSPSIKAIMAACTPDPELKNVYYYFLTDKQGNFYYFKTYKEHLNKRDELRRNGNWQD